MIDEGSALSVEDLLTEEDALALEEAFRDVTPLGDRERVPPPSAPPASIVPYDEEKEVLDELAALVQGEAHFDSFPHSEEYDQWAAEDAPGDVLEILSRGEIPFQSHLDVHGLTREETYKEVYRFLRQSVELRRSCVLLVHGRGKRSPGGRGVLRAAIHSWLRRGAIGRFCLAFTTATKIDGGAGATYVLLRDNPLPPAGI